MIYGFAYKCIQPSPTGAVDYTDSISEEGLDSPNESPKCDIKPHESEAPALEIKNVIYVFTNHIYLIYMYKRI